MRLTEVIVEQEYVLLQLTATAPSVKSDTLPPDSMANPVGPAVACACASVGKFSSRQKSDPAGTSVTFFSASALTTSACCAVADNGHKHNPDVKTVITPMSICCKGTPPYELKVHLLCRTHREALPLRIRPMCPDTAVRPGDKFCSNCAQPLSAANQQTISSTIGDRNIGSFIGNTMQNTNVNFHEAHSEPIALIDRTQQQQLKLFGHSVKTGWFIFAGALGILAQLADISSGFFSGQLHTYMPFWVGMGVMMVGGLCFVAGAQLYRFRFLSLAGQYALQSAQDNSVHLIKISGICPICSGELTLRSVGPKEQKTLMVVL